MSRAHRLGAAVLVALAGHSFGCVQPECSSVDFTVAECRVVAENDFARVSLPSGIEVRFQDPAVEAASSWDARGLLQVLDPGRVRARVAGPGAFAVSIDPGVAAPTTLSVVLDNVDPAATIVVGQAGEEMLISRADPSGLQRRFTVDLAPGTTWIRGDLSCPTTYRIAVTGDIQTNPEQFERIMDRLQDEGATAALQGEPLVGLVLLGDLTESSRDDEFLRIDSILARAPVPVAVTAGNHDIYRSRRPHFNARFGPGNHVAEFCDSKLVLLDSGSGAIARSIEARLPELLAKGEASHLIVGMHHPPYAAATAAGWSMEDRAQHLLVEAAIAGADLIVAAHSHALHHFDRIDVGDTKLEEIVVGTGGAYQGLGVPRYGYLRLTLSPDGIERCFVEVPPPGFEESPNGPLSNRLPYCSD